jgi:hypothetical protein
MATADAETASSGRMSRTNTSSISTRPPVSRTAAISTIRAFAGSRLVVSVLMTTASRTISGLALLMAGIGLAPRSSHRDQA